MRSICGAFETISPLMSRASCRVLLQVKPLKEKASSSLEIESVGLIQEINMVPTVESLSPHKGG